MSFRAVQVAREVNLEREPHPPNVLPRFVREES